MNDERRQHPRQPIQLAARIRVNDVDEFVDRYASDISLGGMRLYVREDLKVGDRIYVEFRLGEGRPQIATQSRVAWVKPVEGRTMVGVEFLDLEPQDREFIKESLVYWEERRRHRRVPVSFEVRAAVASVADFLKTYAVDLSQKGMRIFPVQELKPGDRVSLVFDTERGDPVLHAKGQVRWCHAAGERFEAGVEFTELDAHTRLFLAKLVDRQPGSEAEVRELFDGLPQER